MALAPEVLVRWCEDAVRNGGVHNGHVRTRILITTGDVEAIWELYNMYCDTGYPRVSRDEFVLAVTARRPKFPTPVMATFSTE